MVDVKGKSSTFSSHGNSKRVGVETFHIYAENDKVNSIHAQRQRKSHSFSKGIPQTIASDSKGAPKTMDKSKSRRDISVEINVGRKVLADVSNLRSNLLRTEVHDSSKLWVSMDSSTRTRSSSSSNRCTGKVRENLRQAVGGYSTLKRESKDLKVYVDDLRSKGQGRGNDVNTDGRRYARNPLPPTRKSLSKWVKEVDTSDKKETDENLGNGNGTYVFPVKPKVCRKVIPQVSNTRSFLRRNRVSDGFIIMPSKGQPKVEVQGCSRKSVQPNVKATHRVSGTKMILKSKGTSGLNKSTSVAAISCRTKDEVVKVLSENRAVIVPRGQPAQRVLPSDHDSNIDANMSDINVRRKSNRRKSFTSSLMARSKLLEEHGGVMKQDSLPRIYDDCNHLEVAEYVDEIYHYYWITEAINQSLQNYMAIQNEITPQMRGILINWLIEVHLKFNLMQETLYLTITLLDSYLSLVTIKKKEMQLVGLTALLLASKYEDFWHPRVLDLINISAEAYTRDQMLGMEKAILKKLKFRLNAPTPYVFMLKFLRAAQSDTKLEHLAFYLVELCLVEYEALKFKPSLLCASAIYVARCTLQKTPTWTPLLRSHARYDELQIRDCADMVLKFHKAAKTTMLKVTFEKYQKLDYSVVAGIKPLNELPLLS
ncbi:putative cyclin-B3-1 isoform X1 [Actinidia eriantha]|uniref:putative cyclin-B3-1 isoform X1 n=1 Tax=Actinidia eriantha TaxID=165200 RepID=UPI00258736DF|nr:putative cyclin-B3-1 isoform X1 [Actinidia eriantha]